MGPGAPFFNLRLTYVLTLAEDKCHNLKNANPNNSCYFQGEK